MQLYPLTSGIFGFPFVWMRLAVGGGFFFGISSALLAFALSGQGCHRLLIFFAYPYWAAMFDAQWTPIILAGAFLAPLLPAALAKPQLGLPVLLTASTKRGLIYCALALGVTFVLMPGWIGQWVGHLYRYSRFIPLLVFPGPVLALGVFRYRERDARLLLLAALMPQRWFYDGFLLWFIPKSRREIIWTAFVSWAAGIWRWYHLPSSFTQVGRVSVICFYLPMLLILLLRPRFPVVEPSQAPA
jgi:hypothetical protein